MTGEIVDFINSRIKKCEEFYSVKVLCWYCRGASLGTGRHRQNSDMDIGFIYCGNKSDRIPHAIHDIVGWGYDGWGWNLEDVIRYLILNSEKITDDQKKPEKIFLSKEHARAGLDYMTGVYMMLDNSFEGGNRSFLDNAIPLLKNICEDRIVINYILCDLEKVNNKINRIGIASSYDYLKGAWLIYILKNYMKRTYMRKMDIIELAEEYSDRQVVDGLKLLQSKYKHALTKNSQTVEIPVLNEYIANEYENIVKMWSESSLRHSSKYVEKILGSVRTISAE